MIIGIGYKAGVGKDTVAEHLARVYGFKRFAFADVLRDMCVSLFGWTQGDMLDRVKKEQLDERLGITRRQGLQRLGDAVRREFGDDVLVRRASVIFESGIHDNIVVSDVRKRIECDAIKAAGGLMVRIDRPGAQSVSAHSTETELHDYEGWDFIVVNDSTVDDMLVIIDTILKGRLKSKEERISFIDTPEMRALATAIAGGPVDDRFVKRTVYDAKNIRFTKDKP